jgi:hypothetical protein
MMRINMIAFGTVCQGECECKGNENEKSVSDPRGSIWAGLGAFSLVIASCRFDQCQAILSGGVAAASVSAFSMSDTYGLNCTSREACFYGIGIETATNDTGAIELLSSSVVGGRASASGAIELYFTVAADHANLSSFDSLNSSANDVGEYGSGLDVSSVTNFSLRVGIFTQDRVGNCVFFGKGTAASTISCLYVVNNSCEGAAQFAHVIHFGFSATFSSCIFQNNRYVDFAAANEMFAITAVLIDCVFDVTNVTVLSRILFHFSLSNTTYCDQPTWLPTCARASQLPQATATPAVTAVPDETAAIAIPPVAVGPVMVLAFGIGVPGLFLLVVVLIVVVRVSAERRRRFANVSARVRFEGAFMAAVKDKMDDGMEKDDTDGVQRRGNL